MLALLQVGQEERGTLHNRAGWSPDRGRTCRPLPTPRSPALGLQMVFGAEIFANPFSRLMLDYMSTPLLYLLYLILAVFILVNLLGW